MSTASISQQRADIDRVPRALLLLVARGVLPPCSRVEGSTQGATNLFRVEVEGSLIPTASPSKSSFFIGLGGDTLGDSCSWHSGYCRHVWKERGREREREIQRNRASARESKRERGGKRKKERGRERERERER